MTRADGRENDELRPIKITRNWLDHAAGSVLVEFGKTRVLCAASASTGVPRWRKDSGLGWVTAEYAMLPSSAPGRTGVKGRIGGRTHEISGWSAGRCARSSTTRRWARTRSCSTATCSSRRRHPHRGDHRGVRRPRRRVRVAGERGALKGDPTGSVAAVSVGVIDGEPRLDLPYEEDVRAQTDMNVVMTGDGNFVEVQGTAEGEPFDRKLLDALLSLAEKGCADLTDPAGGAAGMTQVFLACATPRSSRRCSASSRSTCRTSRCSASTTSRTTTSPRRPSRPSRATR